MLDLLTPGILFFSTLFCSIFAEGFFCRFQKDFGMSGLIDKRIILVQELDQNVKSIFPQTTFQNCVDGASIPMTAKRCTQVQKTFEVFWSSIYHLSILYDQGPDCYCRELAFQLH